jgi:hypothetical protein
MFIIRTNMANLLFERASGRLEAPNIPVEATILPPQYAYFTQRGRFNEAIPHARDLVQYETACKVMWTTLCMQIDAAQQKPLRDELRVNLPSSIQPEIGRNPEGRPLYGSLPPRVPAEIRHTAIISYWQSLAADSIYPFYSREASSLRNSGYGEKAVATWILPTDQEHGKDISGNSVHNSGYHAAEAIFPFIHTPIFDRVAKGYLGDPVYNRQQPSMDFRDLQQQLANKKEEGLLGYVTLLQMLNIARGYPQHRIEGQVKALADHYRERTKMTVPSWPEKISRMLKDSEPWHYFQGQLAATLGDWETATFGEQAGIAVPLWRAVTYIRYDHVIGTTSRLEIRRPLVKLLLDKQYDAARYKIEDWMAEFPGILPAFVARNLRIDPETLRDIYKEERKRIVALTEPASKVSANDIRKAEIDKLVSETAQYIDKNMVSVDGTLTLRITRRVVKVPIDDSIVERTVHYIETNDRKRLLGDRSNKTATILSVHAIQPLIEKFGFTFVEQPEVEKN